MVSTPSIDALTGMVESELRGLLAPRQIALYRMMSYHLGWEDERGTSLPAALTRERSHGVACLTACYAAGGDLEVALPAAASVELVDGFAQIHDDVQGEYPQRNNRDAVWQVWGSAQAINAGDGIHALARLSIFGLQDRGVAPATVFRAVQLLDQASLEICEAHFQDIEAQEQVDLKADDYLKIASGKTGALYSCAMKLGALVASADENMVDSLGVCGANIGMAVQIHRDIRELWSNCNVSALPSPQVLGKRKRLPIVYALEKADTAVRKRVGESCFKRVLEPEDVVFLRQVLEELGAREHCEELVGRYRTEAMRALERSGVSTHGTAAVETFIGSLLDS